MGVKWDTIDNNNTGGTPLATIIRTVRNITEGEAR